MSGPQQLLAALALAGCLPDTTLGDEGRGSPSGAETPVPRDGPPALGALELTPAGDCLRLRVTSDRPATATVTATTGDTVEEWALGAGATLFDVAIRPQRLPPGEVASATVRALDADGRSSDPSPPVLFRVPARGAPLAIVELLINPAGPEGTQEYVEIRNLGDRPFPLAGVRLEDDAGGDELPAFELQPATVALVVPALFDPQSAADPAPAAGTPLLRIEGRLGRDGLRQSGEVVRLVGPGGDLLSSYGGWIDASKPGWQGSSVHRSPDPGACDHPRSWSDSPQPPSPGW
jgi:hypothetical protein